MLPILERLSSDSQLGQAWTGEALRAAVMDRAPEVVFEIGTAPADGSTYHILCALRDLGRGSRLYTFQPDREAHVSIVNSYGLEQPDLLVFAEFICADPFTACPPLLKRLEHADFVHTNTTDNKVTEEFMMFYPWMKPGDVFLCGCLDQTVKMKAIKA